MQHVVSILLQAQDQASKVLKGMTENFSQIQNKVQAMQPMFQNMAMIWGTAFAGISYWINQSIASANDLGESINAVNVVFGQGAGELLKFGETANKTVGLSKTAFNQLAVPVGAMLQNMGYWFKEATENTILLTKRASDMASVFNVDVTEAMGAISAWLRGEADPLERFGVSLKDAQIKAYALANWIGAVGKELTEQEKTTARLGLLYQQTAKLEGDFVNTSDQLANSKRILDATMKNITATLGNSFLPIINQVLQAVAPIVTRIGEWVEKNPIFARNILLVVAGLSGLSLVLGTIGMMLPWIITWFSILMGPIWLVALAVTALWVAWGTNFLGIRDKTQEVINFIKPFILDSMVVIKEDIESALTWIKEFWAKWGDEITLVVTTVFNILSTIFTTAFENISIIVQGFITVLNYTISLFTNLFQGNFQGAWDMVVAIFKTMGSVIVEVFKNSLNSLLTIVDTLIGKMVERVKNGISMIKKIVGDVFSSWTWIGNILSIAWARAEGGPVAGWKTYLVGEKWPELFTPGVSGSITPNHQLASNSININISWVNISNGMDLNSFTSKVEEVVMKAIEGRKNYSYT